MYANKNDAYLWVSEYMKEKGIFEDTDNKWENESFWDDAAFSYTLLYFKREGTIHLIKHPEIVKNDEEPPIFSFIIPASKEDFFTLLKILDK